MPALIHAQQRIRRAACQSCCLMLSAAAECMRCMPLQGPLLSGTSLLQPAKPELHNFDLLPFLEMHLIHA